MKKLVILGAGESGVGTAVLGKKKGFEVFVSDKHKIQEKYRKVLLHHEINFEEEQHTESLILTADLVIRKARIPETVPLVQKVTEAKIPDCF